jgi:hypothetical protein
MCIHWIHGLYCLVYQHGLRFCKKLLYLFLWKSLKVVITKSICVSFLYKKILDWFATCNWLNLNLFLTVLKARSPRSMECSGKFHSEALLLAYRRPPSLCLLINPILGACSVTGRTLVPFHLFIRTLVLLC